jgi:signal transduction histidine kinase
MPNVDFQLEAIPAGLRFPIGSFAEWNALLQNVLTNAWNAMLETDRPKIHVQGGKSGKSKEWLRISDTGTGLAIPVAWSDRLFEPFERCLEISEDLRSIAIGGQGLGLTIVRMIARRRGGEVGFVDPQEGYSTAFEMSWKVTDAHFTLRRCARILQRGSRRDQGGSAQTGAMQIAVRQRAPGEAKRIFWKSPQRFGRG